MGRIILSPSSILLHVTDDDGSMASVEIPLTIKNKPPIALGEASGTVLMEGDQVIFTAIGSTDTPSDVPYLNFAWDLNTNSDSDGDGNPANDRDMIGYSVQTNFVKDGSRTIRLMVNDGTETSTSISKLGSIPHLSQWELSSPLQEFCWPLYWAQR